MPKISEFFGVAIYMYYRDHGPSHFHALYGSDQVLVRIDDLSVMAGHLNPRALGLVMEWATIHQEELKEVWRQAQNHEPLKGIEPLR